MRPVRYPSPHERQRQWLALGLLMASLGMFFGGSLLAYGLIRLSARSDDPQPELPPALWLATLLLLAAGWSLRGAVRAVRRERQGALRRWLWGAAGLAAAFIAVQTIGMEQLLADHWDAGARQRSLAGLVFLLVLLHGLHVVGGLVPLGLVVRNARAGRYDHEAHLGLSLCAAYWRFLEIVWLAVLATLWLTP